MIGFFVLFFFVDFFGSGKMYLDSSGFGSVCENVLSVMKDRIICGRGEFLIWFL